MKIFHRSLFFLLLTLPATLCADEPATEADRLARQLAPFLRCFSGAEDEHAVSVTVHLPVGSKQHTATVRLERLDAESFHLEIKHDEYWLDLHRRADRTALILPHHRVAFVGAGAVSGDDTLAPRGISTRLVGPGTTVSAYLPLLNNGEPRVLALLLTRLLKVRYDEQTRAWTHKDDLRFTFDRLGNELLIEAGEVRARVRLVESSLRPDSPIPLDGLKVVDLDRGDLECHLARGLRRALEVLAPAPRLTSPPREGRQVAHGQLRWVDGHRVVLLHGTPRQIGRAHGQLLKEQAQRCIDSVLYMFGTVQTIRTGRWFPRELQAAYERLAPHIPKDHKRETKALAGALDVELQLAQIINVFPELFHCSGFAVSGKATRDGTLYHGRVLDYMTTIGLQDAAATFVIAVDGKIPFVTVGYAGFIGSVSGMNAQQVSLGEMGGGGQGQWDGVPMATLMRRALEECNTLDEVTSLWRRSPRTCEYYYVFADGKTNQSVGVAATPESLELVRPGESHARLGEGIEDVVVLSAGSRLQTLRSRITEQYGKIDIEVAKWLMSRPVAMSSNLHNVLFVPRDGVLYISHADHQRPAADRPYVRLDLAEWLSRIPVRQTPAPSP